MATERKRKEYQLMQEDIDYINEIAKKYRIRPADALSKIISEHKDPDANKMENTMKKILLGVNKINKLSEIQLEISNSVCLKENYSYQNEILHVICFQKLTRKYKKIAGESIKKFNR
ncbi:hypothetical protein [Clostridium akagii]|uniref:hypothetical protein n=1 Tax=Clostridium akagii TaxID=91623 RepID=UPI00047B017D|nr:hypothetical protein [Clostridium akagii]